MLACIKHFMVQNCVIITLGCGVNRYVDPDILSTIQNKKHLIMKFSPPSFYFLPLKGPHTL